MSSDTTTKISETKNTKPLRRRTNKRARYCKTGYFPLKTYWKVGEAYQALEWETPWADMLDQAPQVAPWTQQYIISEAKFCMLAPKGSKTKQKYLFRPKLEPRYQKVCERLKLDHFVELSFYLDLTKKQRTDTGKVPLCERLKVQYLILYVLGDTVVQPDDVLGVMIKPGPTPQVSLWIKTVSSAQVIQKFLMEKLGFVRKLPNGFDGTCMRKQMADGTRINI